MYLVDTSVWIGFFNRPESKSAQILTELLQSNQGVCINAIIEMELLQGIKSEAQFGKIRQLLVDFQYYPNLPRQYFEQAVGIYRTCRKKGVSVRKSVDCLIAANCIIDDLVIVHCDRDFENIRKCFRSLQTLPVG